MSCTPDEVTEMGRGARWDEVQVAGGRGLLVSSRGPLLGCGGILGCLGSLLRVPCTVSMVRGTSAIHKVAPEISTRSLEQSF